MTEHTDKLKEILSTSLQNRNTQYSPTIQEECVKELVELVPHLPEQAEQIIRAATNISDELCHKGHYGNAFRTANHIFGKLHALPNTGMLCAEATQTLINSAMDAGEYETAFNGIRKFMTTGFEKRNMMFNCGESAMKAALDDCAQNPNFPKLKAAKFAAWIVGRDNHDCSYLDDIARIAEQQSQPAFAIECYADIAALNINYAPRSLSHFIPLDKAKELFLRPTETCNIYTDPNIESAAQKLAPLCPSRVVHDIRDALRDRSYNTLALSIANIHLRCDIKLHRGIHPTGPEGIIDLASEALPQLQNEMKEQGHLSPQSTKLCIDVAASCGLILQFQQNPSSLPLSSLPLNAKGLDVAPYQAFDMLFDSRENGKINFLNCMQASGFYPEDDSYINRMTKLCEHIYTRAPHVDNRSDIIDTTTAAFNDVLINYADQFYDEAATENALMDFNRATRPLIPEGYRSLGPGLRQRQERPLLKLAV